MFWKFLDDINFVARCKKYNIGLWQCPNFLFLSMGLVTAAVMFGTYFLSQRFYDETTTIASVSLSAVLIMTIGYFIVQSTEKLALANIIKTEFISILSHQLCGPLSSIKWNFEVLREDLKKNESFHKQEVFLNNIQEANEKMLKMVTQLLEVVRIDQGRVAFEMENIRLEGLIEEVIAELKNTCDDMKVGIDFQYDKDLPLVYADSKKMKVVLDNLISNAVKYSLRSGKVEVTAEKDEKRILLKIRDYGVGIPQYQHSRVFEKFFRSNNSSRYRTEGVGIGLYLAKAILKHFGGEVWFESKEGKGSTFYVSLPAAQ